MQRVRESIGERKDGEREKREGKTGRGRRINKYDCTFGANIWLTI